MSFLDAHLFRHVQQKSLHTFKFSNISGQWSSGTSSLILITKSVYPPWGVILTPETTKNARNNNEALTVNPILVKHNSLSVLSDNGGPHTCHGSVDVFEPPIWGRQLHSINTWNEDKICLSHFDCLLTFILQTYVFMGIFFVGFKFRTPSWVMEV